MPVADSVNAFLRSRPRLASSSHAATQPLRNIGVPVLCGPGRGLRVRVGDSTMLRLVSRVEAEVEHAMLSALVADDVVWDVGANIGWYSLLAARVVGGDGNVTAFEPSVTNAAILQANADRNDLQFQIVCAAASDTSGWAMFDANTSLMGRLSATGRTCVPTITLDDWAQQHKPPTFIKIDVEAAELRVLRGASRLLATARPKILCESHGTQNEIAAVLQAADYSVAVVEMPHIAPADAPWWVHLLGVPR